MCPFIEEFGAFPILHGQGERFKRKPQHHTRKAFVHLAQTCREALRDIKHEPERVWEFVLHWALLWHGQPSC